MIGHDFPYLDTRDLNLDWLLKNMKQLLQDWATYQQNMNQSFADLETAVNQFESDMTTAFNNLHDYVEDYFDNLDVQQEINNKLDDMRRSGELIQIMQPVISTQTAAWLSEHITNPSSPPVDTSLTVSGAAADAKVTGDYLSIIRTAEALNDKSYDSEIGGRSLFDNTVYEPGRLNTNGVIYYDPDEDPACFTSGFIPVYSGEIINLSFALTDFKHRVCQYTADLTYLRAFNAGNYSSIVIPSDVKYIRFNALESERATATLETPDIINGILNKYNALIDVNNQIIGSTILPPTNFKILDPDDDAEIGTAKNTDYTLAGTKFYVTNTVDVNPGTAQRLWFYCVLSSSNFPSGVVFNGIYEVDSATKVSTNVVTSLLFEGNYITIGYFDIATSNTKDRFRGLFGYTYSAAGCVINIKKFDILTDVEHSNKLIYLDVGAAVQYPTFTAAFNYAKGAPYNRYAVRYFGNGVDHDISQEQGNTDPLGLHVPENVVEIIGVRDRDSNIISDSYNNGQAAAFWIGYGVIIRNIYFKGTGKYCIHIDDPTNQRHDTIIENCRFYHATGGSGSIGMGFQAMTNITIRNCFFERDTDAGIRIHNHPYASQTAGKLNIIGNYFNADSMVHAIHLYTLATNNFGFPIANIIGNELNGLDVVLTEEDYPTYGSGNHWRVWGHNNSDMTVEIIHHDDTNYEHCVNVFLPAATVIDTKL